MASLGAEFDCDFAADRAVLKMSRASTRSTNLNIKRAELSRARDVRDWTWGKGIEDAKPHHAVRAAARTCLAKGMVEAQEDMPSIVRMGLSEAKGTRRKPAVAHIVHGSKVLDKDDAAAVLFDNEVETTADEGTDGFETESPQESPEWGPQAAPQELPSGVRAWPSLPLASVGEHEAASGPSHREVALRFAEESLEVQALTDQLRAKKIAAARAKREASAWKTSWTRHRQRLVAAKKAKKARSQTKPPGLETPPTEPQSLDPATASLDFESDLSDVKVARAATRAANLHIKRTELSRARGKRDWRWGKGIEGARPHHNLRAAARTCLAKGMVEAQEDMPSILYMTKPGDKGSRRKPAVAHAVQGARIQDAGDEVQSDHEEHVETAAPEECDDEWTIPAAAPQAAPASPQKQGKKCVIA
jgi:alkylhydroperoxidase family enzyme